MDIIRWHELKSMESSLVKFQTALGKMKEQEKGDLQDRMEEVIRQLEAAQAAIQQLCSLMPEDYQYHLLHQWKK